LGDEWVRFERRPSHIPIGWKERESRNNKDEAAKKAEKVSYAD